MSKILIRRTGAFGDVVVTTPVPRRLKKEKPGCEIHFVTQYPLVYDGNKDVDAINPALKQEDLQNYERCIDLDMAFERRGRWLHATDCYFLEAFGDVGRPEEKEPAMAVSDADRRKIMPVANRVVIHPARSWPHRTFAQSWWQKVVDTMIDWGQDVVVTGTSQDWPIGRVMDTRDQLTPREQVALVQSSRVLIASESGVLGGVAHCSVNTPIVALLTMSPWGVTAPYRNGELGYEFYPIFPLTDCHGCTARQGMNVTDHPCLRTDEKYKCVTTFDPEQVARKAIEVMRN